MYSLTSFNKHLPITAGKTGASAVNKKKKKKSSNTNDHECVISQNGFPKALKESSRKLSRTCGSALIRKPMFHVFTITSIIIPVLSEQTRQEPRLAAGGHGLRGPVRLSVDDRYEIPAAEVMI